MGIDRHLPFTTAADPAKRVQLKKLHNVGVNVVIAAGQLRLPS